MKKISALKKPTKKILKGSHKAKNSTLVHSLIETEKSQIQIHSY